MIVYSHRLTVEVRIGKEGTIHVELIVKPVLDEMAVFVELSGFGSPTVDVLVEVNANDFVRRKEAVGDTLLQRVGENRLAE